MTDGVPDDCGQDAASACSLSVPGSKRGNFEVDGDSDWFAVDLAANKTYRFNQTGVSIGFGPVTGVTLWDPKILRIYDQHGIRLAGTSGGNSWSGDLEAEVEFAPLVSDTCDLTAGAVVDRGPNGVGTYRLSVSKVGNAPPPPDDYPGDDSTLGSVLVGESEDGEIDFRDDRDWFQAWLVGGAEYAITVEGTGSDALDDPRLGGVYDSRGRIVSTDADGCCLVDADADEAWTGTCALTVNNAQ
ncbi:hypothetical protein [Candidatus Poriferisodalis sp.]|uniref:hypothetical protein n=1 Tax=Candidatus Poriferisodalis sp. TaxID=3101277 RepID=UPI003C6FA894